MFFLIKKKKCFALFSGGLDSMLAVVFMQKLGYDVQPIFFSTPFFGPEKAFESAQEIGVELFVHDVTNPHLKMLKTPKYGFGKHMNPCIDCHGLMFREASKLMQKHNVDFLISGEVLGQRPMSQRKDALNAVGKLSEIKDLLIRPLSQKLLADTLPIREGWVKKTEMLDIQGRNRQRQLLMAKEFGIKKFPSPGGGCLLTDSGFSRKLRDVFETEMYKKQYIKFLKTGRHLRISPEIKLIIGRDKVENNVLKNLLTDEITLQSVGIAGPFGVINSTRKLTEIELKLVASILLRYNSKVSEKNEVAFSQNGEIIQKIIVDKMLEEEAANYLV